APRGRAGPSGQSGGVSSQVTRVRRLLGLLMLGVAACGYHLAGTQRGLPEDVRSLSVGTLTNRSREFGLETTLRFAFDREVHVRGHFRMAEEPGDGDAVLNGTIRDLSVRPVAFDSNDLAVQYEMRLTLDLALTRQRDGHVLWRVKGLRETDEYSTAPQVVV